MNSGVVDTSGNEGGGQEGGGDSTMSGRVEGVVCEGSEAQDTPVNSEGSDGREGTAVTEADEDRGEVGR